MKKTRTIKENFLMNIILMGSAYILPFLMTPYVSRILLPEGMGKISFATSVLTYFTMFAMLGVPTYGIRACAIVRDNKEKLSQTVQEILLINIVMSIVMYSVFIIALFNVPELSENKFLFAVMSSMIFLNVIGAEWVYRALEEYKEIAIRSIVMKALALALTFILIHRQEDIVLYGAITIIASSGSYLWNFISLRKYVDLKPNSKYTYSIKKHLKPISIFFSMSVATTIYTNLDVVMLGFLTNDIQMGYYDAAVKIKMLLVAVVSSLGSVLLPRVSYYLSQGMTDEFKRITSRALNCILLLAVPLAIYSMLFVKPIISLISGKAFLEAIPIMQVLMPTIIFIGMTNIMGIQMLVPLGKENWVLYSEILGACVNIAINTILIPKYAAYGAAVGTLIAELCVFLVQFWATREYVVSVYKKINYKNMFIACFLAGFISNVIIKKFIISTDIIIILISVLLFFFIYGITLILVKEPEIMNVLENIINLMKRKNKGVL